MSTKIKSVDTLSIVFQFQNLYIDLENAKKMNKYNKGGFLKNAAIVIVSTAAISLLTAGFFANINSNPKNNRNTSKKIEQLFSVEKRASEFSEVKKFVKTNYKTSDESIKYIFQLNFDDDSDKEYAVFLEKNMGRLEHSGVGNKHSSEYIKSNGIMNLIIKQEENGSFKVKHEDPVYLDNQFVGIKCRDFDRDGKDELLVKIRSKDYSSLKEHDYLELIQFERGSYAVYCETTLSNSATGLEKRILDSLYNSEENLSPADAEKINNSSFSYKY